MNVDLCYNMDFPPTYDVIVNGYGVIREESFTVAMEVFEALRDRARRGEPSEIGEVADEIERQTGGER